MTKKLMANFEVSELTRRGTGIYCNVSNIIRHSLGDGAHQVVELRGLALGRKFYSAVRQVSYEARYVEALGELTDRVAEPDALHVTAVIRLASLGGRWAFLGHDRTDGSGEGHALGKA
jgi:hypothetical protein